MTLPETIHIRLLFDGEIRTRLLAMSAQVAALAPSRLVLGTETPPHITLFAFEHAGGDVRLPEKTVSIAFTGLHSLGAGGGSIWVALGVKKTPALDALRAELLEVCGQPRLRHAEFVPHVTLGHIAAGDFTTVTRAFHGNPLLSEEDISCRVDGVVHSVENGYRPL